MAFGLKWVHMGRYGMILRQDRALWLTIIFKPLLTPQRAITIQFQSYFWMFATEKVSMICNVTIQACNAFENALCLQTASPWLNQFNVIVHHGSKGSLRHIRSLGWERLRMRSGSSTGGTASGKCEPKARTKGVNKKSEEFAVCTNGSAANNH